MSTLKTPVIVYTHNGEVYVVAEKVVVEFDQYEIKAWMVKTAPDAQQFKVGNELDFDGFRWNGGTTRVRSTRIVNLVWDQNEMTDQERDMIVAALSLAEVGVVMPRVIVAAQARR